MIKNLDLDDEIRGYWSKTQKITIESPIPQSIEWHRLTRFRHIEKFKSIYPNVYSEWKKQGLIPRHILENE